MQSAKLQTSKHPPTHTRPIGLFDICSCIPPLFSINIIVSFPLNSHHDGRGTIYCLPVRDVGTKPAIYSKEDDTYSKKQQHTKHKEKKRKRQRDNTVDQGEKKLKHE
jgi:hypothetical protein